MSTKSLSTDLNGKLKVKGDSFNTLKKFTDINQDFCIVYLIETTPIIDQEYYLGNPTPLTLDIESHFGFEEEPCDPVSFTFTAFDITSGSENGLSSGISFSGSVFTVNTNNAINANEYLIRVRGTLPNG